VIGERHAPRVAALVLAPLDAAERTARGNERFAPAHPARDVLLDLPLEVVVELLIELALDLLPAKQGAKPHRDRVKPLLEAHDSSLLQCNDLRDRRREPRPGFGSSPSMPRGSTTPTGMKFGPDGGQDRLRYS
jgi:hypothetical protein